MAETRTAPTVGNTETSLRITRRIRATPEELFDAWTDAQSIRVWMCPGDVTEARATLDTRVGGKYQIDMVSPQATYEHRGEYLVVDRPRKLAFTWVSIPTQNQRSVVTVEFTPAGSGETELTLMHENLPSAESTQNHKNGWTMIVEKLAAKLER